MNGRERSPIYYRGIKERDTHTKITMSVVSTAIPLWVMLINVTVHHPDIQCNRVGIPLVYNMYNRTIATQAIEDGAVFSGDIMYHGVDGHPLRPEEVIYLGDHKKICCDRTHHLLTDGTVISYYTPCGKAKMDRPIKDASPVVRVNAFRQLFVGSDDSVYVDAVIVVGHCGLGLMGGAIFYAIIKNLFYLIRFVCRKAMKSITNRHGKDVTGEGKTDPPLPPVGGSGQAPRTTGRYADTPSLPSASVAGHPPPPAPPNALQRRKADKEETGE